MQSNKWNAESISDQSGRVAIVTGSSSGIGYETARVLAMKNATVIIAVRNPQKGEKALQKIKDQNQNANVMTMVLDLADLNSIRSFVAEFALKFERLDLLINNAGVMAPPYSKTVNGFELQFGTNHLGHFALTMQLMDLLRKTSGSRIVTVSSNMHKSGNLNFDDLNWEKRKYKAWEAYGASKIANLYFTYELDHQLKSGKSGPLVTASHPGWTATELQRHTSGVGFLNNFFAQDITMGALPTLYAAVGPDVQGGDYYGPSGFMEMKGYPKKTESDAKSKDKDIARKLWQESEKLTGVKWS
ncbi:MAG: SDR family NAD(P)-dependent oxidoreductase [Calditrichales bacterium]|nr:MAG: SDR family NAD(P)-dependent oxidoreductase [Calditrichales bacterium]